MLKQLDLKESQGIVDLHTCVQGEGRDTGTPAFLIRMSECNMNCQFKDWVCDSAYTSWRPEKGKYSLQDISDLVAANPQITYAFITGGNPSLNPILLQNIVSLLKDRNIYVAIEDNGTLFSEIEGIDFVTLSPKLTNSIPQVGKVVSDPVFGKDYTITLNDLKRHENYRTRYDSMIKWINRYDHQLKFVVSDLSQLKEVEEVVAKLGADKNRVYLMPEGVTKQQLESRRQWLVELCIEKGYKFTDRLHIVTYDSKREA